MLDLGHVRHEIRELDELLGSVAPGDHDMLRPGPVPQHGDDLVDVHPSPVHRVGELVQHVQLVRLCGEVPLDLLPALAGLLLVVHLGVALHPRPPFAHLVPVDGPALAGGAEHAQRVLLPDLPLRRLDELEHPDGPPLVPGAQRQPEGGRGLALPDPRVHHDQRPVAALTRRQSVLGYDTRLPLWHYAALLEVPCTSRTSPAIASARNSSNVTAVPPSSPASRPASPSRTGPASQSTTTEATWSAANSRAARSASAT